MSLPINTLALDLETCAESVERRDLFKPTFDAPANYVDKAKIDAALAKKEADWASSAALSALTGRILCVGCWTKEKGVFVLESGEREEDTVQAALDAIQSTIQTGGTVVGFNCLAFDLPFLCQRAWRLGVHVPTCLHIGKWWSDQVSDLMIIWSGPGSKDRISLDHLSKALGVGAKNGNGAEFGELWKTNKLRALEYVRNDISLIKACAERML